MQQRASLCRALIHEPSLLMLDEPFGALDAFTREELWDVLQGIWMRGKFTTVLVTHDLREAAYLADTIHVMSARPGRVIASYKVDLPRPRTPETAFDPKLNDLVHRMRGDIKTERDAALTAGPGDQGEVIDALAHPRTRDALVGGDRPVPDLGGRLHLLPRARIHPAAAEPGGAGPGLSRSVRSGSTRARRSSPRFFGFGLSIIFGVLLGVAVGSSKLVYRGFYPILVGFNSIPKVAIVPVLVVWFGIGAVPAVLTAFLMSFFPIAVNVATGLATVEPELEDVLRSLGAKRRDFILKIGLPRAMPYFFASTQGCHYARLRRLRDLRIDRVRPGYRDHDGAGRERLPDLAGVRRSARHGGDGNCDVCCFRR